MKKNKRLIKLTEWEHWNTPMFYLPLIPYFIYKAIRAGSPVYYLTANPKMYYSGIGTESKFKTILMLPEKFRPKSILIGKGDKIEKILLKIKEQKIDFPVICKPDIGFRGYLVKKIENEAQLLSYRKHIDVNFMVQEFIPYLNELGIFYHRMPGEKKGKITSVTIKKFMILKGNGKSSLEELILQDNRAFLYYDLFKNIHQESFYRIPEKDEKIILSVIGNHSKGTEFLNGNHLINNELEAFINSIAKDIDGWYYGRMDIKYNHYEAMLKGKDFKILEVNGIISEPTHIYDATHPDAGYLNAVKSIKAHWNIIYDIALKNNRKYKIPYPETIPFIKNMFWLRSYTKKLKELNRKAF